MSEPYRTQRGLKSAIFEFFTLRKIGGIMKRRTLHDEENNEDYYYESMDGIHWYSVEPEEEEEEEE